MEVKVVKTYLSLRKSEHKEVVLAGHSYLTGPTKYQGTEVKWLNTVLSRCVGSMQVLSHIRDIDYQIPNQNYIK